MTLQAFVTALLVLLCSGYAAWTLMPAALRARLLRLVGKESSAAAAGCGGCGGCGPAAAPKGPQPVKILRRPPSA